MMMRLARASDLSLNHIPSDNYSCFSPGGRGDGQLWFTEGGWGMALPNKVSMTSAVSMETGVHHLETEG